MPIIFARPWAYSLLTVAAGIPLSELDYNLQSGVRKPAEITIVRSRIFYAKPATTAKGLVHAGFKHIRTLKVVMGAWG